MGIDSRFQVVLAQVVNTNDYALQAATYAPYASLLNRGI